MPAKKAKPKNEKKQPAANAQPQAKTQKQVKEVPQQAGKAAATPPKVASKGSARIATAIIVIAIIIIAVVYVAPTLESSVPFSTFKSNFQGAARVSVTATFSNESQYSQEGSCFSSIIQVIAHSRQASTIDFFLINQANATCTYSTTGLGGSVNPTTTSSSYCLGIAKGEPGIFLNYSATNSTQTTASGLYVYGNSAYMTQCPIAVELS